MTARNATRTRNGRPAAKSGRVTPKKPRATTKSVEVPSPAPAAPEGKLRLLKVVMQPTFVLVAEDGSVQEIQHPVIEIKGVDWRTWSSDAFSDDALEHLRQTITPVEQT